MLATPFGQIEAYDRYVSGRSPFGTHQGVKGLEFPRVMVVISDDEARGFLFNYDKLFGLKEKSAADLKREAKARKPVSIGRGGCSTSPAAAPRRALRSSATRTIRLHWQLRWQIGGGLKATRSRFLRFHSAVPERLLACLSPFRIVRSPLISDWDCGSVPKGEYDFGSSPCAQPLDLQASGPGGYAMEFEAGVVLVVGAGFARTLACHWRASSPNGFWTWITSGRMDQALRKLRFCGVSWIRHSTTVSAHQRTSGQNSRNIHSGRSVRELGASPGAPVLSRRPPCRSAGNDSSHRPDVRPRFDKQMKRRDADSKLLNAMFDGFKLDNTAVLSMNWDMVFKRGIALRQEVRNIEYGCHATPARFHDNLVRKRRQVELGVGTLNLLKPHGSINWLYCDACRELFWVPPNDTERVAQTLFQDRDWRAVFGSTYEGSYPKSIKPHCPHCSSQSLGTRIATFSYRKALDFPMHAATWRTAEEHLKTAIHWVFFGYSMPAADFEFKYLLKRVQLTESIPPNITVITGGGSKAAEETIRRYKQFFGDGPGDRHYFSEGLTEDVVTHLRSIEALNPVKNARRSNARSTSRGS